MSKTQDEKDARIDELEEQLEQMQKQISVLQSQTGHISNAVDSNTAKINSLTDSVTDEVDADLTKDMSGLEDIFVFGWDSYPAAKSVNVERAVRLAELFDGICEKVAAGKGVSYPTIKKVLSTDEGDDVPYITVDRVAQKLEKISNGKYFVVDGKENKKVVIDNNTEIIRDKSQLVE